MVKSATFGVVHLGIAFGISYTLTGDVTIAGAITLIGRLQPSVLGIEASVTQRIT